MVILEEDLECVMAPDGQDGKVSLLVAEDLPVSSSGTLGRDTLDPEQYVTAKDTFYLKQCTT